MRLKNALKSDIKFQKNQGFYAIYVAITLLYIVLLSLLPQSLLKYILPIIIFSDPSGVGLFFIGGILMLEREQGILTYLKITPLRTKEYLLSKVLTLSLLALVVSLVLTLTSDIQTEVNYLTLVLGVFSSGWIFTCLGIMVSIKCKSLNGYFLKIVPTMLFFIVPCISVIGFKYSEILWLIPSSTAFELVYGSFHNLGMVKGVIFTISSFLWAILIFKVSVCKLEGRRCHVVPKIFNPKKGVIHE